jgi:ketosteroid isomerase-like protein
MTSASTVEERSGFAAMILDLEARRIRAMVEKDVSALAPLLADDLSYVHSGGRIDDKPAFLELIARTDRRYIDVTYTSSEVVPCGPDVAIVRGIARLTLGRPEGETVIYSVFVSVVYHKREEGWQLVVWHATRAPE